MVLKADGWPKRTVCMTELLNEFPDVRKLMRPSRHPFAEIFSMK